jgi:signal transduction histidine kinase
MRRERRGGVLMGFRDERFGLLLIGCSLLVIAVICGMQVASQLNTRRERIRAEGVSLARVLSTIPYEQLVPRPGRQGPLDVVKSSVSNADFAYGAIVAVDGRPLAQVTAPGVILPVAPLPQEPAGWNGERLIERSPHGRRVREFIAPVVEAGQHVAHVRVGFFEPGLGIFLEQASFLGMLALPIFLLTPLAYFLIRRGVRPLAAACAALNEIVKSRSLETVQIDATGEVGEFIRGFNQFMELARARVRELEGEKRDIVASSKIVAYQKGRIQTVLECLPDATLVLDETGTAVFANGKLESILGVPLESALGHRPEDWCEDPRIRSLLETCRGRNLQRSISDEIEISAGGSDPKTIAITTHPLIGCEGSRGFSGTLVVARDVTNDAIARRAQDEFMIHMSHELKGPLNVMAMYGETLLGEEGADESFRVEASNVIRDEVERLATLISTLLSIARIEAGAVTVQRQRVRLQDFLADVVDAVSRSGRHAGLRFAIDVPADADPIFVEKELFRVAVNNLLTNAIKYNRADGEVTVSVEESAHRVSIRVRDTGLGIREEDLPHVFEKFYRSDDNEIQKLAGHGLGLSLTREIVELHGGSIEVQTEPGVGSEFSIVLRRRARDAEEDPEA